MALVFLNKSQVSLEETKMLRRVVCEDIGRIYPPLYVLTMTLIRLYVTQTATRG
jgi:hypothetical protein